MFISMLSTAIDLVASTHHHTSGHHSSSSGFFKVIPLLFLLTGPAFYFYQYTRYRNKDKRHHHETETLSDIANMRTLDQCVNSVSNSRDSRMSGANEHQVSG